MNGVPYFGVIATLELLALFGIVIWQGCKSLPITIKWGE